MLFLARFFFWFVTGRGSPLIFFGVPAIVFLAPVLLRRLTG